MTRTYKRKPGRVSPDRRMARAVELRAEGLSVRQIGDRLNAGKSTIARDLARWDRAHPNVTPLVSQIPVPNSPPGGHFGTPEWDSDSTVVQFRRSRPA
jgi:hypothetical protein